ncbi:MAG: DUF1549 domain-containing protein, partial [Abitibacteriaceae bacterium]|nr:DUF1549 domain-containing protein [Abditibacteriaceae bacterium]
MKPLLFTIALLGLVSYGHAQFAQGQVQYVPLNSASSHQPAALQPVAAQRPAPHPAVTAPVVAAGAAKTGTPAIKLPPAAQRKIDYVTDIHPILRSYCASCHLSGQKKGGLQLDTRDAILKGGGSGPAAAVGKSADSLLIHLVAGVDPDNIMPLGGKRLTPEQIGLLRAWIDQGMSFGKAASATTTANYNAPLEPRHPALPPVAAGASTHPIDRILAVYFKAHNIQPKPTVDDRTYARRVYLDIVGLLPTPEELQAFIADKAPNKRELLAQRLLADDANYAQHWLTFWNDALRNDYAGTGYIDGGRQQITDWLYNALLTNMPY